MYSIEKINKSIGKKEKDPEGVTPYLRKDINNLSLFCPIKKPSFLAYFYI